MKVGILSNESAIWQTLCTKMALFFALKLHLSVFMLERYQLYSTHLLVTSVLLARF